jgi:ppGpp synthetase/RelA/SpoT-type nucleotidyltranferase
MALREKAAEKWSELKQKLQDKKNRQRVEEEIRKRLKQAQEAFDRIEKDLKDPETQARMENKLREASAKLKKAKAEFTKKKAEVVSYAKEHPEKALVAAAATGAVAGALWMAFRGKK